MEPIIVSGPIQMSHEWMGESLHNRRVEEASPDMNG